jgi:hypothetical protein
MAIFLSLEYTGTVELVHNIQIRMNSRPWLFGTGTTPAKATVS